MSRAECMPLDQVLGIIEALGRYISTDRLRRMEEVLAHRTRDVVVVLEDIFDDHNTSAVFRTAEALGVFEIHCIARRFPLRVSHQVTRGAHKWLDLHHHTSAQDAYTALRGRGYSIWAAGVRAPSIALEELPLTSKIALVFGNEHSGLSVEALGSSDGRFSVPMLGFVESFNISVAAAVSMYALLARRREAGVLSFLSDTEKAPVRATWYTSSVRAASQILRKRGLLVPLLPSESLSFVDGSTSDPEG